MKISERDIMTECNKEEGSALIIVLGLITLISLLTVSIVTFSQISDRISKVTCERAKALYWAEGAVDRTIWLLRHDIVKHPTRTLGKEEENKEIERFLADGTTHSFDNYDGGKTQVSIFDAVTGLDIAGSRPTRYMQRPQSSFNDDMDAIEDYKLFLNALTDYVDANDFTQMTGGFEKEDYDAIEMSPLPRNYAMEYKYEILWVPGFQDFFSVNQYGRIPEFRIIAPLGLRQLRGNDNFFAADKQQIQIKTSFTSEQMATVIQARSAWKSKQIPLSESLDPGLLSVLQKSYSFRESGFYTFRAEASPGKGFASRVFTCTLQVTNSLSPNNNFSYYEWRFLR